MSLKQAELTVVQMKNIESSHFEFLNESESVLEIKIILNNGTEFLVVRQKCSDKNSGKSEYATFVKTLYQENENKFLVFDGKEYKFRTQREIESLKI